MASAKGGKERLVVEVVGAHNLMPKDGEGSSSPFVEVEFENQRLRTGVRSKDLNPIWNEKLVFDVKDINDLPYKTIEVSVFNERKSGNSRNFLGKIRLSGSAAGKEGEEMAQLHVLDKRSLFSHVRGEISLKLYVSNRVEGKEVATSENDATLPQPRKRNVRKKLQQRQGGGVVCRVHSNTGNKNQKETKKLPINVSEQDGKNQMAVKPLLLPPGSEQSKPLNFGSVPQYANLTSEFSVKETDPNLGGGSLSKNKASSPYDLVEQMQYLYVMVAKAKDIVSFGGGEVVVEVKLGNYRGITNRLGFSSELEWNQVFAFSKDSIQSSMLEILVKEASKEEFFGRVSFDLNEAPRRVPPDSPLAPQWYRMETKRGDKAKKGEIMVSVWFGTQADEAFAEAWHSKAANVHFDGLSSINSKVYLSPKLWYLRAAVIEAQDIVLGKKGSSTMRYPELSAKVQVGNQVLRTNIAAPARNRNMANPLWNSTMFFVVGEPLDDYLFIVVEDRVGSGEEEPVGKLAIPVNAIERRFDDKPVASRWLQLDTHLENASNGKVSTQFGSRIHLLLVLEGGYHVFDEATSYTSDVRPSAKQLWSSHVGVLEVGILGASGLMPMKLKEGKGETTDAYCVAKYGQKWVRTRTAIDNLSPKWNEQYTWEVFDPCTVITIGVFDNARVDKNGFNVAGAKDSRIGKVRIRLSTLETERVYTHTYPLLMLHPTGLKKMGELHLAVRFSCANLSNILQIYSLPLFPKMHYLQPLSVNQVETLRCQALLVVTSRLNRAEPPLGREVVEYILDHESHLWSLRRSKANFSRLVNVFSLLIAVGRWSESIRSWKKPLQSALFLIVFLSLLSTPELIPTGILLCIAFLGIWRYRRRPRLPPFTDARLSYAELVYPDELDEEFDSFPTSRGAECVRTRYDQLRCVAGRIQTVVGDIATQAERIQSFLTWRDPRATFLFISFCLFAAVGFYIVPFRVAMTLCGLYTMRPPRFRSKLPSKAINFFRRLPTNADSLL